MTQFASGTRGMMDGMRIGMEMRNRENNEKYMEDQNRRANEQHSMDMEMQPIKIETAKLNNDIARQSAELAKTNAGFEELKRFAGGVGAFMGATANGQPVSPDAKRAVVDAMQVYFGNTVNQGGPEHLDQRISDVQMTPQGATVMLNNTNKKTGESYEAPMTVGRQAGEKTVAALPGGDLIGLGRVLLKTAIENNVDPRIIANGFAGGEQWVDGRNENGVYGQRNTVTGKFDEGRESIGERIAAQRAGAEAAKDAELNWQERNADRIAGMDLNRERAAYQRSQRLNQEFPERAAGADMDKRLDTYYKSVADIRKKVGTKDPMTGEVYDGSMADDQIVRLANELGVTQQVGNRLPNVNLSRAEQEQADTQAAADVEGAAGMWSRDSTDMKQFGGASTRADALQYQQEKRRQEALASKMQGMGLSPNTRGSAQPAQQQQATPQQAAALKWLKENPNDPRAPEVARRLGL